jgi:hypothetical protein
MKVALRSRGRRLALFLTVSALILLSAVAPATASATSVQFSRGSYVAPLGQALPEPISVTVKDELGDPVSGVEVAFSVTPDSTGATADLSALTATTDVAGVAQITGTAGAEAGFPTVHATVDGVSSDALIVNRPPGYRPGEQLASIVAQNQDGVTEDLRDGLADKNTYLLVDVCAGWCTPCKNFAQATQSAIAQLAVLYGVKLKLVTVLMQDASALPSNQPDALGWKDGNGLTDSVFHAGGSAQSALYRAAGFFLYNNDPGVQSGAFPTHLLVDPKGNILDRRLGFDSTEQTVDRVLADVNKTKAEKPPRPATLGPAGQLGVQLPNGETHSDLFDIFDSHTYDWGTVSLFDFDSPTIAGRYWTYLTPGEAPLAAAGTLTTSLTRFKSEAKQPLTSSSVQVIGIMELEGEYIGASATLPAIQKGDTVTVAADLAALRAAMRAKLEAGGFFSLTGDELAHLPPLTTEQIDALVDSMFGISVAAQYTIITKK